MTMNANEAFKIAKDVFYISYRSYRFVGNVQKLQPPLKYKNIILIGVLVYCFIQFSICIDLVWKCTRKT